MKLKYLLPTACEITRLEIGLVRCNRAAMICDAALVLLVMLLMLCMSSCTLRVEPNGTRTWGTDPAAAAAIVHEIIDNK